MLTITGTILFFVLAGLFEWVFNELVWRDRAIQAPQCKDAPEQPADRFSKESEITKPARSQSLNQIAIEPNNTGF